MIDRVVKPPCAARGPSVGECSFPEGRACFFDDLATPSLRTWRPGKCKRLAHRCSRGLLLHRIVSTATTMQYLGMIFKAVENLGVHPE